MNATMTTNETYAIARLNVLRDQRDRLAGDIATMPTFKLGTSYHMDREACLSRTNREIRAINEAMGY